MSDVRLLWVTPDPEKTIAYCARISNPDNRDNPEFRNLLRYCLKNGHWSIFEMAEAAVEITTTLAIVQQITRHRSADFQMFSRRYSGEQPEFFISHARRQDVANRQSSIDDIDPEIQAWWKEKQKEIYALTLDVYNKALENGIAKECARFILPSATQTQLVFKANLRTFIHYIELRKGNGTQLEHAEIALKIADILKPHFPIISELLGW